MIDNAPTKPNALARLFPITIITIEVITERKIMEFTKLLEYPGPRYVNLYINDTIKPHIVAIKTFKAISGMEGEKIFTV